MLSSIEHLTTVAAPGPPPFFRPTEAPAPSLYFHLVLRTGGSAAFDERRAEEFGRYVAGLVRRTGGSARAVTVAGGRVHLLVGLSQLCALGTFVREFKLLTAAYATRRLGLDGFVWEEKYEAFTVSCSQIERVAAYIRRQKSLEVAESYGASWNRLASRELY